MAKRRLVVDENGKTKKKSKEKPTPKNWLHSLWLNWIKPIGSAVLIVFAFRWTFLDWNDVPSSSMEPTILIGDRIAVNKLAYFLKFPFTHWKIASWDEPDRGEIVVFFADQVIGGEPVLDVLEVNPSARTIYVPPGGAQQLRAGDEIKLYSPTVPTVNEAGLYTLQSVSRNGNRTELIVEEPIESTPENAVLGRRENKRLVKRVVAVPGDTIEVRDGMLFLNGREHEIHPANRGKFIRLDLEIGPGVRERTEFGMERLSEQLHPVMFTPNSTPLADFGPATVPDGHFFMMGDNRNRSRDSRDHSLGFVPMDGITGRAFGVAFSLDRDPSLGIRFDRFFRSFLSKEPE